MTDIVTATIGGRTFGGSGLYLDPADTVGGVLTAPIEGWGNPGTRGDVNPWPDRDGAWSDPAYYDGANYVLRGVLVVPSFARAALVRDQFVAALPMKVYKPLIVAEAELTRYAMVRVVGTPEVVWDGVETISVNVQFVATDHRRFAGTGPNDISGSGVARLPITDGGLVIPPTTVADTNWSNNPSFEVDTSGWVGVGGALTRETVSPPAWIVGTAWGRLTTGSGATRPGVLAASSTDQRVNLSPGDWAAVSMLMANDSGYTSQIGIRFFDSTNTRISESMSAPTNNTGGRVTHSAQAPAGTIYAQPVPYLYNGGTVIPSGVKLDFDAVKISAAATQSAAVAFAGDYFDGGSAPSGGYTFRYTSTAGKSTSEKVQLAGLTVPFAITATVTNNAVTVGSSGTGTPRVVVTIAAVNTHLTNPQITDDLGNRMTFNLVLTVGQFLVIDLDKKTILLNGTASRRTALRGSWINPRPGMTLTFNAEGFLSTNQATATVAWTDTWN
ncbi:phage distal tail protein [Arthrobacter woluwensis]|uniref:Siphovirus-type tail component C-terminal domain-containing protein n=1 Tax=Arthrobacter woluwensis TaxID=156980 RepID=A0A1H4WV83_9MICC|nr:hypothetical protein [Arthrobacter woluwensis]SEC96638.1 hypothetical protein SAMN04489745_3574 [Arthrobacter woluwensis]